MPTADTIDAKIGSYAPDFRLPATNGTEIGLSDFRGKANVVLFFVREFLWMQCRAHVAQLGRMYEQFKEAGADIVVILGDSVERAQDYVRALNLPFPVLADPERRVYHIYELEKYFLLIQRTASLVIDQAGVVRYLKRTTSPLVWLQESREIYGFVDSLNVSPSWACIVLFDASLPPTSLKDVPAIAKAAEQIGFSVLWTSETQHDPFLPCTLIAEHTSRLQFGTAIAVSFARSPANLAYTAWDLAAQSGGRFILGLGTQVKAHIERRYGMAWPESVVDKLREQIQLIHAFWDCWQNGTKLNFRGEYYKITLMSPFFMPPPLPSPIFKENGEGLGGGIPIYIAGVNTGLAKLAGEMCEGFHAHPFHSPRYLREVILPAIEAGAQKANRKRQDVAVSVSAFVATSPEEENFARAQLSFYASTPSYRSVMNLHGWGDVAEKLSAHAAKGEWTEMPLLITDEMLNEFCLVTSPEKLASGLKKRYDGIADRLGLYSPFKPGERDAFWRKLAADFNT